MALPWKGNIRELDNVLERAMMSTLYRKIENWGWKDDPARGRRIAPAWRVVLLSTRMVN